MSRSESRQLTELQLADIIAISADAIVCLDGEQRITLFNNGASSIFGWTADEVMGKSLDMLLPERFRGAHWRHITGFGASPDHARRMGERREIAGLRKNGQEFAAEAAIAKVQKGDTAVFSVVLRDISEQMALQKRLFRALMARDETVGMVAHDLRNPLSAIKMLSASLLDPSVSSAFPTDVAQNLALIRSAADQMDQLIRDLLDVTRVEVGHDLRVDPQPIAVADLLDRALRTLRPLTDSAGIQLNVDPGPGTRKVLADAARIGQVLSNLIGNSLKCTPRGGKVLVSAAEEGDAMRISVSDTGSGISREQLPNVFDRFWQSPQVSIRVRGAGLGLPIARGIVQSHGGRIWAESEEGRGSTFHFTLPLAT